MPPFRVINRVREGFYVKSMAAASPGAVTPRDPHKGGGVAVKTAMDFISQDGFKQGARIFVQE